MRRCQSRENLEEIDTLILDEIHERSLDIDLCMALVLSWQERGTKIRSIAMSATLDEQKLQSIFNAPILKCEHKPHDLDIVYHSKGLIDALKNYLKSYSQHKGHILVSKLEKERFKKPSMT